MLGTVVVVDTRPPVEYAICALRDTTSTSNPPSCLSLPPASKHLSDMTFRHPTRDHPRDAFSRPCSRTRRLPLPPRQRLADRRCGSAYRPTRRARPGRAWGFGRVDPVGGPELPCILVLENRDMDVMGYIIVLSTAAQRNAAPHHTRRGRTRMAGPRLRPAVGRRG
jgi:hypothetical protein